MEEVTKCHCHTGEGPLVRIVKWKSESQSKSREQGLPFLRKHSASRVGASSSSLSVTIATVSSRSLEAFPADIIFNIFSRLPVKSLMCCRCVCKIWRNIIDSPSFTNMHFTNTTEEPELMLLQLQKNIIFFSLMNDGAQVLRSSEYPILEIANSNDYVLDSLCYGLFCFKNLRHTGQVFLLNPLRGEVLILPPTRVTPANDFYGVGFDCTTETYKVVRVFPRKYENHTPHHLATEVYTLGTRSWREIPAAPPGFLQGRAVSAYGDVHWAGRDTTSWEEMIISFDTRKEEFKLTPHPKLPNRHIPTILRYTFRLIDFRGHLAMIDYSLSTHLEVWLLKDYDRKEWAIEYRISAEVLLGKRIRFPIGIRLSGIGAWEHGLLFCEKDENLVYYNTKTDSVKFVRILPSPRSLDRTIVSYNRSLVSLKNSGNMAARVADLRNYFDLSMVGHVPDFA